jgi:hypothetical protein
MKNTSISNEDEFKIAIALYAEIIYALMQQQPSLYDSIMPKTTFKLIEAKEPKKNQSTKIAA